MYSGQSPSPQLGKSTYSSGPNRKDVLWNVVEPGDPYDIRKSMIARLPGIKSSHFMGDNLEIVCLFQSAEIQRLCEFLDDYKFRYRDVERRQLDRHSYQVQIKQLTQQLADQGAIRNENAKLKDFIKKQTIQIEELKSNRFNFDNNLRASYEESLTKFQALLTQNRRYREERETHLSQITSLNIRIQALQSAMEHQKKQLTTSYTEQHKYLIETQTRAIKIRYESEISRLELELKRFRQFNDAKNSQINQISNKYMSLLRQIQQLRNQKTKGDPIYEQRFALMGQQIQRLNLIILQSTAKIDQSARNQLYHRERYSRLEEDYRQVEIRYREASQQLSELKIQYSKVQSSTISTANTNRYDEQIRYLNQQIHRLQSDLILQSQKYTSLQKQYSQLEYNYTKISLIERENAEMKNSINSAHELKRKVAEYETKIAFMSQQIQRLRALSQQDVRDRSGYDTLRNDYEEFKRKSLQKERTITSRYESEMQRKVIEYEARLAKYAEESGSEFQFRLQAINRQVEKLNQYLKQKTDQSEAHKRRIRELENSISQKYEVQTSRQFSSYEITIKQLKSQNEQASRRLRQFQTINRRVAQYQNTIAIMRQQIQRLTFTHKTSIEEIDSLRKINRQLEQRPTSNVADFELTRKISLYEQNQLKLTRENQDLRRKLQQIVELNRRIRQYEDKIRSVSIENDRLNLTLRERVDALNRSQITVKNLSQEVEVLRRNKIQIESSFSQRIEMDKMQTSRKFTTYEQSLSSVQREYQQLRRRMLDMGNDSNRKIAEYENKIALMTQQIDRINQTLKLKVTEYQSFLQSLRNELEISRRQARQLQISITQKYELQTSRKISNYEQNLTILNRELDQLRKRTIQAENAIRKKNQQIRELQNRCRVVVQQFETYKLQVRSFEGEINKTHSSYQQNLVKITREYEQSRRRIMQYENRLALISQENERLNAIIRNNQNQMQSLRKVVNDTRIQITQKYELETSRKINTYQQTLANTNREREEARRKIIEYQTLISNYSRQLEEKKRHLVEFQGKYRQLQITVSNKYQVETTRRFATYQQTIQTYTREIQAFKQRAQQYQNLRIKYEKEISRLNMVLKTNVQEQERLKIRIHEVQNSLTHKYESETSRQTVMFQQSITNLNNQLEQYKRALFNHQNVIKNQTIEIQQLRRKIKEYGDVYRTVSEYQGQFIMLKQQLQRVNGNLRIKVEDGARFEAGIRQLTQENQQLKRKIKQTQISIVNKYQLEVSQKSSLYEQNIVVLKRQNEQLRHRINQSESKIVLMTQQIQRLNIVLKQKVEQITQSQQRSRNLQQQLESYRRKVIEVQKSSTQRHEVEITHTISVYQQKFAAVTRQYEAYKVDAGRRLADHETRIAVLSQELERENQNIRTRNEEIQRLQRTVRELEIAANKRLDNQKMTIISTYEQNMTAVSRQHQEYRVETSRKITEYERRIQQLTLDIENQRKQNKQVQISFSQKFELQINRRATAYEQSISNMRIQIEQYDRKIKQCNRKIAEDENRIVIQTQEIQRLNQVLKGKVDESKHYQNEVQKYVVELQNLKTNLSGYYSTEVEKLNGIIRQRNQQLQLLQQKFTQVQAGSESGFKQLQSSYSLMSKQYQNSKKHLVEYEQSIRKLSSEFERLQIIINELKTQRQTLFDKNHGLIKQIQRLTAENKDQQSQIYEIRLKLADDAALQKRINQHLALMVVLFAEIQTLRQRVKDKEKQVQEVRRSSLAPLKA